MFLYNYVDEISCHKRRYSKKELFSKLKKSGFKIKHYTSFVFILFPVLIISRITQKRKSDKGLKIDDVFYEFKINKYFNKIFEIITEVDVLLIRMGFRLPFWGSLIVVAEKL